MVTNGGDLDTITKLKLQNLKTWLEVEQKANEQLTKEGLLQTFNKGTSVGVNPLFKALTEAHKYIIKYLRELGIKNAQVESGDDYNPLAVMDEY